MASILCDNMVGKIRDVDILKPAKMTMVNNSEKFSFLVVAKEELSPFTWEAFT